MEIRKIFTLDEETYLEYANFVSKGRSLKTTLITAVVIAVVVNLFFKTDSWLESFKYMGIYAGSYILIALLTSRVLTPRMMRNTFRKKAIGSVQFDVLITETGMTQTFEEGAMEIPWADFKLVQETENSFFFTLFNKRAILLPKKILSGEELVEFRNLLNQTLSEVANQLTKFEE